MPSHHLDRLCFVNDFNKAYTNAKSRHASFEVFDAFVTRLLRQIHDASDDAVALETAVRSLTGNHLSAEEDRTIKRLRGLLKIPKRKRDRKHLYRKTIVALWGLDLFEYYSWQLAGVNHLRDLERAAIRFPTWEAFSPRLNTVLILRHENSRNDAREHAIGQHAAASLLPASSPGQPSDFRKMLELQTSDLSRHEHRIEAWLSACSCLGDIRHFTIRKDRFGLLVPTSAGGRATSCAICATRPCKTLTLESFHDTEHASRLITSSPLDPSPFDEASAITPQIDATDLTCPRNDVAPSVARVANQETTLNCIDTSTSDTTSIECSLLRKHLPAIQDIYQRVSIQHSNPDIERNRDLKRDWLRIPRLARIYAESEQNFVGRGSASAESADVVYLDWTTFLRWSEAEHVFKTPVVIKQAFQDTSLYTLDTFITLLSQHESNIDVQDGRDGTCHQVTIKAYCHALGSAESADLEGPYSNAINLQRVLRADEPLLTRLKRFRLLSTLTERRNADIGKLSTARFGDITSSLAFGLSGLKGSFSGPHVDALSGTYVRTLLGTKLWIFAGNMNDHDLECFVNAGAHWRPNSESSMVILEKDDVLFMPPNLRSIHAVFTLETSLMEGGMIWDELTLPATLDNLLWIATNQRCTNEAIPLQLPEILDALDVWIDQWSADLDLIAKIKQKIAHLKALGCRCIGQCWPKSCSCAEASRRCVPWCNRHKSLRETCMQLEMWLT